MAQRFDRIEPLAKPTRTDSGLLRAPARLTRVGVFQYRQADGSVRNELRAPEEVFSQASLDSLKGVPVVEGHPAMIDGTNWAALAKGDVRDDVQRDGDYVAATLAINDAGTVAKVEADPPELVEISCGYTANVLPRSGVYDGQPYEWVQTDIRYNHVGMGPKDWGRAGNEVRLHMDAADCIGPTPKALDYPSRMTLDEALQALGAEQAKVAALTADLAAAKAATDVATAKADAAQAKADAANADLAKTVATMDGRVAARIELEAKARTIDPKFDCKGKSDADVQAACVAVGYPALKLDGKSADYVSALFDALVGKKEDAGADALRTDASKADGGDPLAELYKKGVPVPKNTGAIGKGSN